MNRTKQSYEMDGQTILQRKVDAITGCVGGREVQLLGHLANLRQSIARASFGVSSHPYFYAMVFLVRTVVDFRVNEAKCVVASQ
jgi:hypothetical protein